jgi:hypothetical protein
MEYNCKCCNYTTLKRFNYDKHLASVKHNRVKEKTQGQPVVISESPQVAEKVANDFKRTIKIE